MSLLYSLAVPCPCLHNNVWLQKQLHWLCSLQVSNQGGLLPDPHILRKGPADEVEHMLVILEAEETFVRRLDTRGIPYHSPPLALLGPALRNGGVRCVSYPAPAIKSGMLPLIVEMIGVLQTPCTEVSVRNITCRTEAFLLQD